MYQLVLSVVVFIGLVAGCAASRDLVASGPLSKAKATEMIVKYAYQSGGAPFYFSYHLRHDAPGVVVVDLWENEEFVYATRFSYEGGFSQLVQDVSTGLARAADNYVPRMRDHYQPERTLTVSIERGSVMYRLVLEGKVGDIQDFIRADVSSERAFWAFCRKREKLYRIIDLGKPGPLSDSFSEEPKK